MNHHRDDIPPSPRPQQQRGAMPAPPPEPKTKTVFREIDASDIKWQRADAQRRAQEKQRHPDPDRFILEKIKRWEGVQLPENEPDTFAEDLVLRTRRATVRQIMGGESRFDDFDWETLRETQVTKFLKNNFNTESCLMLGGLGSGKTLGFVLYAAHLKSQQRGLMARLLTAYDIAQAIFDKNNALLNELEALDILIIDEMGAEGDRFKGGDFARHFENLFNTRYQRKKRTFMISNLELAKFKELYGERVISRLRQTGQVFETTDPDFRKGPTHE